MEKARIRTKEKNNHKQGRSNSKVKTINGPAKGRTSGNPTKKGKIFK